MSIYLVLLCTVLCHTNETMTSLVKKRDAKKDTKKYSKASQWEWIFTQQRMYSYITQHAKL